MLAPLHSRSTPLKPLKWYKKLATTKGRLEAGAFLIEGDRGIRQIMSLHPDEIMEIITVEKPSSHYHNYPVRFVTEQQFHSISSTKTPQGIMALVRLPKDIHSEHLPKNIGTKILLLEDIQDPGNVGSLIRTAAAFNFSGVILTEKSADPLSPKCVQSTAGTILSLWLRRTSHYLRLVEALKKDGYSLVATELKGRDNLSILHRQDKLLLALGNEASGLSPAVLNISDYRLRIHAIPEKAESLNVAACGAICMYLSS